MSEKARERERKREKKMKRIKGKRKKRKSFFFLPLDVLDVIDLGGARVGRVDADYLHF